MIGEHGGRELPHAGQRGQIGLVENRLAAPCPRDLIGQGLGPRFVAAVNQDLGPDGG